jgi:predicted nucleic acid binding AN1-type Zn finger protein
MGCDKCKRKGVPIDCKYCEQHFCPRCIQLEVHNCDGIQKRKDEHLKQLEKQLEFKCSTTLPTF